ncbi:MAG: class I SAM-dependent methyltransferase [Acidimicrobiales bacterium]
MGTESLRVEVESLPWYHTIELPGGIVTPGEYDHRPIVAKVPLPERLDGLRCIDIGTHDGFWAFEMERRGASGVLAIDVEKADDIDWPEPRPQINDELRAFLVRRKHAFEVARDALGSRVERRYISVYELEKDKVGTFDVAFLGTLLHHLRDPIGALQGVRRVVEGRLVLVGVFSPLKTALLPFTPVTELLEYGGDPFYEMPNLAGLRRQLELGGWEIERWGGVHLQGYGTGWQNAPIQWRGRNARTLPRQLMLRRGALHVSVVARPR